MFSKLKLTKKVSLIVITTFLSACTSFNSPVMSKSDFISKEKLYNSTQNYNALISLYRNELKVQENDAIRYKLAESYYKNGDSRSSLLYLKPLLGQGNIVSADAGVLEIRNLIQLKEYRKAIEASDRLVIQYPNNAEVYNLKGIAYAQLGQLDDAQANINKAREFFLNDVVAINNLAMLYIINGDYLSAVNLLLPQYMNGIKESRLVHNLVFALVKNGDKKYALDIIKKERLNTSPESLVNALEKTERVSNIVGR